MSKTVRVQALACDGRNGTTVDISFTVSGIREALISRAESMLCLRPDDLQALRDHIDAEDWFEDFEDLMDKVNDGQFTYCIEYQDINEHEFNHYASCQTQSRNNHS